MTTNGSLPSLQTFDTKIASLERELRQVKEQRNAVVPGGRLPPEILTGIFDYLTVNPLVELRPKTVLQWIGVTHVCRSWRWAALCSSELWGYIHLSFSPYWLAEMLRRSWPSPIWVLSHSEMPYYQDALGLVFEEPERIKGIHILSQSDFDSVVSEYLTSPMPLLEHVHFHYESRKLLDLPSLRLGRATAPLRTLDLFNCQLDKDWNLFPSTETIEILKIGYHDYMAAFLLNRLWIELEKMPNLQVLELKHAILGRPDALIFNTIHFPRLERLVIHTHFPYHLQIFDRIRAPAIHTVQFNCFRPPIDYSALSVVFAFLGINPSATVLDKLELSVEGVWSTDTDSFLRLWVRRNEPICRLDTERPPSLALHFPYDHIAAELYNSLPINDLCSLSFARGKSFVEEIWVPLFKQAQLLEEIQVRDPADIISVLSKASGDSFPALRRLIIKDGSFIPRRKAVSALKDRLSYWSHHRTPITSLKLINCGGVTSAEVASLSEVVLVDWDGVMDKMATEGSASP